MLRIGLTGGIGSGKSTVAELLRLRGAALVDADAISREVTGPGGLAIPAIRATFGAAFIDAHGALDRDKMRHASYADAGARRQLEAIIHPLVGKELARQESAAIAAGVPCLVYDIPLLVESGRWRNKVDGVLVVDCTAEVQTLRVMARSGLQRSAVEKIIAVQATRAQRLRAADMVIFNAGDSMPELAHEAGQVAHRLGL